MTTGEKAEQQDELAAQLQAATEVFQGTAGRLLREGETAPQLIVLAAARVAGDPWVDRGTATGFFRPASPAGEAALPGAGPGGYPGRVMMQARAVPRGRPFPCPKRSPAGSPGLKDINSSTFW